MSKLTLIKTNLTATITFVVASFLLTSNYAFANTIKINLDTNNCVTSLSPSDKSSCATEFPGVASPCQGKKDCICTKKEKHIEWQIAENSKKQNFTIDFDLKLTQIF